VRPLAVEDGAQVNAQHSRKSDTTGSPPLVPEGRPQVVGLAPKLKQNRESFEHVHIRRETVAGYLRAMGIPVRPPGGWGKLDPAKPANEVITDFGAELPPLTVAERKPIPHSSASISANYCEAIELVRTAGVSPPPTRPVSAAAGRS
jgi:hypothetical protein